MCCVHKEAVGHVYYYYYYYYYYINLFTNFAIGILIISDINFSADLLEVCCYCRSVHETCKSVHPPCAF
jgi:hypothetical protein